MRLVRLLLSLPIISLACTAGSVEALPNSQVADEIFRAKKATVINRPCSDVWIVVNDFSAISSWYSGFKSSRRISNVANRVGEVRELIRSSNGQVVHEKLVYLDPVNYELAYSHTLNPPVRNSIALVALTPSPTSQCLVTWGNTFSLFPGQNGRELTQKLNQAYETVLADLKSYLESKTK